jgi:hypothetical protein
MTIQLTPAEAENHFYNAMCNGLGELSYYDLEMDWDEYEYRDARLKLENAQPNVQQCFEDILMEMLRSGNTLWIVDQNDDERHPITLDLIHERVQLTPIKHLMDALNERDDAITADCILQTVIYKDIIFG